MAHTLDRGKPYPTPPPPLVNLLHGTRTYICSVDVYCIILETPSGLASCSVGMLIRFHTVKGTKSQIAY